MNFSTCAHGNIEMTCPQCRGRQPVGPGAPPPPGRGHSDARGTVDLNLVIDGAVARVERSSNQSADRRFWPKPTEDA